MSHTVQIQTEFKNWEILQKTLEQLGWTIKQNTKLNTYPSDPQRDKIYKYAAINPQRGGYDVGIDFNEETGEVTQLHYDPFGGSIERSLGVKFATLKKEYVINVTKEHYEEVEILEQLADGSIILEADDGL